jgi:hypothetical protein
MRIMEIAMIHVRYLACVDDQSIPGSKVPKSGVMAHERLPMLEKPTPRVPRSALTTSVSPPGCCSAPTASAF